MRSSLLGGLAVAVVCLPCLLVLLVAAGLGTAALSAIGSALSQPGLAVAAAVLALLLFAGAAIVFMRRRTEAACETDVPSTAGDDGRGRAGRLAASYREEETRI